MSRLVRIPGLATLILLSACQLVGLTPPPDFAATSESMTRIAAAVSATQGLIDEQTAVAPTQEPTIVPLSFDGVPLTGPVINVIIGVWPLSPNQSTIPNTDPLCNRQCVEELWITLDGRGTLSVGLFEFATAEQLTAALRSVRATQDVLGIEELDLPENHQLPADSWIQDNGSSGSRFTLHTYQGRALAVLTLYLPDYDVAENVVFLSLFGEKQIEMLKNSGW